MRAQRKNLIIGSAVGLLWMVGKVSVPLLVRYSIDRGIEQDDMLLLWVSLIAVAGVAIGLFTALRRFYAFREARWTEITPRETAGLRLSWVYLTPNGRFWTHSYSRLLTDLYVAEGLR